MTVERPHTVCARMNDDERAFVAAVARSQNKTVSTFAREAILFTAQALVKKEGVGTISANAAKAVEEAEAKLEAARQAVSENSLLKMAASIAQESGPGST